MRTQIEKKMVSDKDNISAATVNARIKIIKSE